MKPYIISLPDEPHDFGCYPCIAGNNISRKADVLLVETSYDQDNEPHQSHTPLCCHHAEVNQVRGSNENEI